MRYYLLCLILAMGIHVNAQISDNERAFEKAMSFLTNDSTRNLVEGFKMLQKLSARGYDKASIEVALMLIDCGDEIKPDTIKGVSIIKRLADKGNSRAQSIYAGFLRDGIGVKTDTILAMNYDRKAADQGNIISMNNYARALMMGANGVTPDTITAIGWYRRAAEKEDAWSHWQLARYYVLKDNDEEARYWLKRGYKSGSADCIHGLGLAYLTGRFGYSADEDKALECFELASNEYNYELSMLSAGKIFGGRNNLAKQREYYQKAAEMGNLEGKVRLADTYSNEDNNKMFELYLDIFNNHRISPADDPFIIDYTVYRMGVFRYLGIGCEQDKKAGAELIYEAADNGLEVAIEAINNFNIPRP